MKKSRKIFALLFCCILWSMFLLSGCGPAETNEDKRMKYLDGLLSPVSPVEISVRHYYTSTIYTNFANAVDEFNRTVGADKGIFVSESGERNIGVLQDNIIAALNGDVGAPPLPDIVQTYTDLAYIIEKEHGLANLDEYFRVSEIDAFIDSFIEEGRFGGDNHLKILPLAKSTEVLVLNKKAWEAFEEADGTVALSDLATMEGLSEVSEKFYDRYQKAFFGRDSFANYLIAGLKQLGEDIFTVTGGTVGVCENKSAYKRLWDSMYIPSVKGWYVCGVPGVADDRSFRSDQMQNEEIIAYIGSTASAGYIPVEIKEVKDPKVTGESRYDNDVILLPLPVFEGGEKVKIQQGAGMSVLVSDEKKEYASAVFLKWFTENERNLKFAVDTGYSPAKKAVSGYDEISASEAFNHPNTKPNIRTMLKVCCEMNTGYKSYFTKGFESGVDIRDNLLGTKNFSGGAPYQESMQYRCVTDRAKVVSGERDLETFLDSANFESWYADFIAKVKIEL